MWCDVELRELRIAVRGLLRIGFVLTTEGPALSRLSPRSRPVTQAARSGSRRSRPSTPTGPYGGVLVPRALHQDARSAAPSQSRRAAV